MPTCRDDGKSVLATYFWYTRFGKPNGQQSFFGNSCVFIAYNFKQYKVYLKPYVIAISLITMAYAVIS